MKTKLYRIFIVFCLLGVLIIESVEPAKSMGGQPNAGDATSSCHFGLTIPWGFDTAADYDLSLLGIDSYLDWTINRNPAVNPKIDFIRVVNVSNSAYPNTRSNMADWVNTNRGKVWIIGNEPDTVYENQDGITPESYGQRFFELATIIRNTDPTARTGFAPIVQPTPIRLRYLDRVWTQMVSLAGSSAAVSSLIDIFTIHNFILNEMPGEWGTGIPLGFENDHADKVAITNFDDIHSPTLFQARLVAIREWMENKGEQNKPLWIAEYGVPFPPFDPPGYDYVNDSDEVTRDFMLATFDIMMNTRDPNIGYSLDENRLVQKAFWFSLYSDRTHVGGALYDPNTTLQTILRSAFIDYAPQVTPENPDLYPISVNVYPRVYSTLFSSVDYGVEIRIGNDVISDWKTSVVVSLYEQGILIGTVQVATNRCGGDGFATIQWLNISPGTHHTLTVVVQPPAGMTDIYPPNNSADFDVYAGFPQRKFVPAIHQ